MVVFTGSDSFPEETYEFSNNSDYDRSITHTVFIYVCGAGCLKPILFSLP